MCPPHPCGASPAVAGHESPPFRRDTKRPLRGLHESHKGDGAARNHESRLAGGRLRYDKARRDAAPPKAETPRWGKPHRAGRASARLRCGTWARKDDNGPTDAAPETFVLGRRPISCPAKRGFVSTGSGGDAAHRKGMGWRRPCSHGSAQSLSRRTANGSPPRRWLSWSRASACRNDGFRQAPTLRHEASFFGCDGSILHTHNHTSLTEYTRSLSLLSLSLLI